MRSASFIRLLTTSVLLVLVAACVDDEGPVTPPSLDADFIGYSNPQTRQTTCGNCHISKQRDWGQTAHATAFASLEETGEADNPYCQSCHTTNGLSNLAADSAGYFAVTGDAKDFYKDVQCEACHGAGAGHVTAPDDAQPFSSIAADTAATTGCATCHRGNYSPYVSEWQSSLHGRFQTATAGRAECQGCHEGKAIVARFDPDAKFMEQGSTTNQPIVCAACHDPHGGPNGGQLRRPIDTPDLETNLCMSCHARRFAPDPTSSRGSHSPQGPMLLGEAGWLPPDFAYDATRQASSHGSTSNPRLCAGCHVESFPVRDSVTNAVIGNSVGHRFLAIPCVDATGRPTGLSNCADTERRWNTCSSSGCHATANAAMAARQILAGRLQGYQDVLWKDKDNDGTLDALPIDSGLLAQVKATSPTEFSTTGAGATVITVGEGAWFNAQMIRTPDGSMGVHNPFYAEALLLSSTQALRARYTYLPAPPANVQATIDSRMRALGMRR